MWFVASLRVASDRSSAPRSRRQFRSCAPPPRASLSAALIQRHGEGCRDSLCYAPCSSDTDAGRLTRLCSDSVGPPSVTLGTLGMALHNLSRDTGDLFTSLSFLLYLLIFPMSRSDYLPRVFLMFSLIYFRSSSGSSINSSTIVGGTQTKNLVVFQFRLRANPF